MAKTRKRTHDVRKLITSIAPKSPISEQYRTIRTNIQFSSIDEEIHTITVTSSGPIEGKSTTIANLAVVFAQQGKKVLLIDADLRRPTTHYFFQLPNTLGLTSVLTKQVELQDAIRATDVQDLFVLTSGPIPPNPAELLASRAMGSLVNEAKGVFDVILFDTPPILAVTDAHIMANITDGSILVLSSGKTEIEAAQKAKEMLNSAKAKLLGAVLNNKKQEKNTHYYYYYN